MAQLFVSIGLFVVSLLVLLWASDTFTSATARVGLAFGISPFIIGATVVAGGTSLPELVSAVVAVTQDAPAIVLGNVVGSNIANIFIVLGLGAVVGGRIYVERELMRVDLPLLVVSTVFLLIAVWTSPFDWYEGVLALLGLAVYIHYTLAKPARLDETVEELVAEHVEDEEIAVAEEPPETVDELEEVASEAQATLRTYLLLAGSLAVVFVAADQLVAAILAIAGEVGVGAEIVAITAVGVGTSLPEIAVSVAAVRRGDPEIAVGNVLGSNVFNTFAVMAVPSFLGPLVVPANVREFALPVMVLATVLYYFITQDREITRWEGAVLLLLYAVFLGNLLGLG